MTVESCRTFVRNTIDHTANALAVCELFARQAGFAWAGSLALGAGEGLIHGRPLHELGGRVGAVRKGSENRDGAAGTCASRRLHRRRRHRHPGHCPHGRRAGGEAAVGVRRCKRGVPLCDGLRRVVDARLDGAARVGRPTPARATIRGHAHRARDLRFDPHGGRCGAFRCAGSMADSAHVGCAGDPAWTLRGRSATRTGVRSQVTWRGGGSTLPVVTASRGAGQATRTSRSPARPRARDRYWRKTPGSPAW